MALLQYVFDGAEKEVKVKPHGNAKNSKPIGQFKDAQW